MKSFDYSQQYYEKGIGGFHESSFVKIAAAFESGIGDLSAESKILDFGCGDGFYGSFLRLKASDLRGVDASDVLPGNSNKRYYQSFERVDLGKLWNSEKKYDVLFSIEVIEHVEDYRQFLRNAFSALEPGGRLFLTTTTYFWTLFVMLIVFRRQTSLTLLLVFLRGLLGNERARTRLVMHFWNYFGGHYHGFSKRQLRSALKEVGFSIEHVEFLHVQKVFPVRYLNQPYQRDHKWLVDSILPLLKALGSTINWACERFDFYAPNVIVIAKKPTTSD